jgi:hypothetical protein
MNRPASSLLQRLFILIVLAFVVQPWQAFGQSDTFHSNMFAWNPQPFTMPFQTRWELTRADITNVGSLTDSFKETWEYEAAKGPIAYLISPRARVPVTPTRPSDGFGSLPKFVFVTKENFAKLLGVPYDSFTQDLVTIQLYPPVDPMIFNFQSTTHEYYSVNFQINY